MLWGMAWSSGMGGQGEPGGQGGSDGKSHSPLLERPPPQDRRPRVPVDALHGET